jgi:hypothetical protein
MQGTLGGKFPMEIVKTSCFSEITEYVKTRKHSLKDEKKHAFFVQQISTVALLNRSLVLSMRLESNKIQKSERRD